MTRFRPTSFCLLLALVSVPALAGTIETTEGKTITGEVSLMTDGVSIAGRGTRPATVPLARIRRVKLLDEKETPAGEPKWNDFDLGDVRVRGSATPLDDDRLQLAFGGSGFSLRRRGRGDQLHFRYMSVGGDFEFSCRLLTTNGLATTGRVGLLARENMDALAASASVACEERISRTTAMLSREQPGDAMGIVNTSDRAVLGASWLRLTRKGDMFRGYESLDGKDWKLIGEQKIVMGTGGEVFVGLFGYAGGGNGGEALFDHVDLTRTGAGGKALAATPANGYVTPSGSIVSVRSIMMLERGPKVVRHDGTEALVPTTQIARILCSPRYALFADRIEAGKTGLLLSGGDFVEGQVDRLGEGNGARLNSVLFGLKHFDVKNEVAAAVLGDVKPVGPWEIRTRDGSVYRAEVLNLGDRELTLREPALGELKIANAAVTELRRVE